MNDIAELIRNARTRAGLSQFELAHRSGLSLRIIGKAEKGVELIKIASLQRIFSHVASRREDWRLWLSTYLKDVERDHQDSPQLASRPAPLKPELPGEFAALAQMPRAQREALRKALDTFVG